MSIFKKAKSILENGLKPYEVGKKNYENPKPEIEQKAIQRKNDCVKCDHFTKEPISFLKVEDERISELSNMMCNVCGCTSAYLLRQDLKICKFWTDEEA